MYTSIKKNEALFYDCKSIPAGNFVTFRYIITCFLFNLNIWNVFIYIAVFTVCSNVESRLCQADESAHNNSIIGTKNNGTPNMTDASLYLCPRPNDAQHLTECCFLDAIASCCERKHQDFISGIDDRYLVSL